MQWSSVVRQKTNTGAILKAISQSAPALSRDADFDRAVNALLKRLGEALGASRVHLSETHAGLAGALMTRRQYEWSAPGVTPRLHAPELRNLPLDRFGAAAARLRRAAVHGEARVMPAPMRRLLFRQGVRSLMLTPVRAARSWCWSSEEVAGLQLAADLLGGAIERRRIAEQLRFSDGRYRELAERACEGVSFSDDKGIIRYSNRELCRMLGYRPREVIGRSVESLLDEIGLEIYRREDGFRRRGVTSRYELSLRSKTGDMIPMQVSAVPVYDEQGCYRGGYGVFMDIRERARLGRMKDDILREISHELKAPVAKIRMGLDLVKKHVDPSMNREGLLGVAMIETEVARIRRNIDLLTDLSAFESGSVTPGRGGIDIEKLLRALVSELCTGARQKGLTLSYVGNLRGASLRGDVEKIHQLFRNVIENAIKFSRSGTIAVSARVAPGGISVTVKDEGRGIEPAYLEKIFERNYQRYPSDPGLGIGLTLCRMIATMHGGRIRAQSAGRGKGMTVRISLPSSGRAAKSGKQEKDMTRMRNR
jgi:PAS domain S-box-containing protein